MAQVRVRHSLTVLIVFYFAVNLVSLNEIQQSLDNTSLANDFKPEARQKHSGTNFLIEPLGQRNVTNVVGNVSVPVDVNNATSSSGKTSFENKTKTQLKVDLNSANNCTSYDSVNQPISSNGTAIPSRCSNATLTSLPEQSAGWPPPNDKLLDLPSMVAPVPERAAARKSPGSSFVTGIIPNLTNPNLANAAGGVNPIFQGSGLLHHLDDKSQSPLAAVVSGTSGNTKEGKEYPPCKRAARCVALNHTTCLGATLFYKQTSVDLVGARHGASANVSQAELQLELSRWQALRNVPKCWAVIQALLCAVYMPRCDNGMVDLPSQEICRATRGPCRVVEATLGWPKFLRCDAEDNFPVLCKTDARELRFNTNSFCQPPLVATDTSASWYGGWEGCGPQCHNPLFTAEEHDEIHSFIGGVGCLSLLCSLFTVLTFFIDWKSANKYPALIIFYISGCHMITTIGWLAQFTPGARDDIVCRKDGTLRKSEPSSGENLSCVIVFVMIYYFSMASIIWFVMLAYSWYVSFKALGKIQEVIEAKTAYFHLVAWSLPLVLTITILAMAQVDGDSVSGICFVGYANAYMRVGFVMVPITISLVAGGFFLIRALRILVRLKMGSGDIISHKASAKIWETIIRLGVFTGVAILLVFTTFACHIYEYAHQSEWDVSLHNYIICTSNLTNRDAGDPHCVLESRPSVAIVQIHLLAVFGAGIIMSTWIWTPSSIDAWKRFTRRAFHQPINEPIKLTKHKMIAKAFARRREINGGRMSFSFQSTHDDPLGMKLELNSNVSQEISSTWQAALPKFLTRRGAFMGAGALGLRRNSSASEAQAKGNDSANGPRRHSLDSQISFHMSESERQTYMAQARQKRRRKKKNLQRRNDHRVAPAPQLVGGSSEAKRRRGSDVSQQSDFGNLIPYQLLASTSAAAKINNIRKDVSKRDEARNLARPATGLKKRNSNITAAGQYNFGFLNGIETSSDDHVASAALVATTKGGECATLPGQIGDDAPLASSKIGKSSADCAAATAPSLRERERHHQQREDDRRSTDNESIHRLGEHLSNSILSRVIRTSQSDLEMKTYDRQSIKSTAANGGGSMNNSLHSGRRSIVDMAMDSDNRDSSSS